ncbi:MAG: T9SS type A sorting domain-containing protein [Bacteroidota bacterium]|jgi:Secretion system C-terminal sorting domain
MRKLFTLLVICSLTLGVLAQNEPALKPQVTKNCYFDVSPPLRDLVRLAPKNSDNSWKEGVVKNILFPPGMNQTYQPQIVVDRTLQNYQGTSSLDSLLLSYDGINGSGSLYPPDTDGDVGTNNYFQVVNSVYAIYDKAGNKLLGPALNSSIFSGLPHNSNDGDAVVLYDEVSDRWIFTQFSLPTFPNGPFWEMVAVSSTNDPLGTWNRYQFQFTDMPDYPKLGVWPDGIYMTANRFSSGSTSYLGTLACCFDKAAMYAASSTANMVSFTLPSSNEAYAVLPSDCDGNYPPMGTPNFFAWLNSGHIRMYGFTVDWTTPSNSTYALLQTIPVASYNTYPLNVAEVPQPGTSTKLDLINGRLMFRLPFRKFNDHWSIVCSGTVKDITNNVSAIRWWELRNDGSAPANWSIYQESTWAPDATWRWMGSIAMDSLGNIALGYSLSSSTVHPSVCYAGRLASDPLSTFTIGEKNIVVGGGSQTSTLGGRSRWGDYSAMNADPSSPGKFWYTQEYYATTSAMTWKTRIGAFSFGNILMATATAVPSTICVGDSTQLGVSPSGGSGTYTFSWTSNPAGFTSTQQNPVAHPAASMTYIVTVNDGVGTITDSVDVTVQHPATSNAGVDTTYCNYVPVFTVHGSGTGYDQSLWTTLGDGTFDHPQNMVCQYTPWTNDKTSGHVSLILTTHSMSPCHGNTNDTLHITFDPCTGIVDLNKALNISVQPNPSNGIFDLNIANLGNQSADVVVTDIQGHQVFHKVYTPAGTMKQHIDLSFLAKGSYIMKVTTETRNQIEKIIIE